MQYLPEAIASLRAQDPVPAVLVVDNASRSPVGEVEGARVIRSEDRLPLGLSRNFALPHVDTEFVMFCDADDRLTEGALRALYEALKRDPQLGFATGRIVRLADDGSLEDELDWPPRYVQRLASRPRVLAMRSLFLASVPALYTLYRTQVVRDAGGFGDVELGEDWSLVTAVAFRTRGVMLDRPVRGYRFNDASIFHQSRAYAVRADAHRAVRRRMLRDPAVPPYVKALMPLFALNHWQALRREKE